MSKNKKNKQLNFNELSMQDSLGFYQRRVEELRGTFDKENIVGDSLFQELKNLKQKKITLDNELDDYKKKQFAIKLEMTNQYKLMQEQMRQKIRNLNSRIKDQEQELEQLHNNEQKSIHDTENMILIKDEEIKRINLEIEELNLHFSNILKQTLEKMREKIEISKWEKFTKASNQFEFKWIIFKFKKWFSFKQPQLKTQQKSRLYFPSIFVY